MRPEGFLQAAHTQAVDATGAEHGAHGLLQFGGAQWTTDPLGTLRRKLSA